MRFKNTIWAGGAFTCFANADVTEVPLASGQTILPGSLAIISLGAAIVSGIPTVFQTPFVVLEDGAHRGGDVDTAFTAGQEAQLAFPRSGETFNILVTAANSTSVGQEFAPNAGVLVPALPSDGTLNAQFIALENTAASASNRLVTFKKL
tara:strand:- start:883 stop:1332 length:450 start_codon:yes stop_codon:yes gene_type:complete